MAAIKPQPLTGGSYRQQLWDSIKTSEGEVLRIYSDSGGVPTIGAGYALIQKIKGIQTLRDPKDIAKDLGRTLNSAELTLLERQARLLNGQMNSADETYYRNTTYLATAVPGSSGQTIWQKAGLPPVGTRAQLTGKQRLDLAKAAIPVYQTGQNLQQKNRFSFALSAGEPRQIFDRVAKDVEAETLKQIRAVGRNHRFPQADIDRLTDGLLRRDASGNVVGGSREMIALFSLQYNIANKFPETIKAALGGDRARMYLEPIQKVVESDESFVIHCRAPETFAGGARCGNRNIDKPPTAATCVTRAI